ncbi:peptide deformylase [Campylobacter sp. RM12327]|uniref:peptide deformylase n=1 Tax=Campylobacter sputorum TaxID=206 RepID=UPI00053C0158|nr:MULTISPECIES: peptide deformylase [Campylobacter]ASM39575.1 peptide deformylase [Campylobacter sputorum]MBE7358864.1 peptide deformylase [Campylobacter sp. RM11302]MBF6669786.1 peptide deformylase [Campylobacter sp. RM12327]MBF6674988.1 peptide deformylase [Campylobacter sp. RM13538]MBF6676940.1 peptide deformylase [Campylobacter sp. RM12321]
MILKVLTYPNKILYEKSAEVTEFNEELGKFLDDMYETMINKNGIGLAAIQVGKPIRAIVINLTNDDGLQDKNDLIEIINPIITRKENLTTFQEGCLSVPGFYEDVQRAENIRVEFFDRQGQKQTLDASGLLAICIQHECDHLDGHLFIEKIGYRKRKKFEKEFKEKQKAK